MDVDVRLRAGGLDEVAEMKRKNPPAKSPIMKILSESMNKTGEPGLDAEEGL
jgi:hypothetical protein